MGSVGCIGPFRTVEKQNMGSRRLGVIAGSPLLPVEEFAVGNTDPRFRLLLRQTHRSAITMEPNIANAPTSRSSSTPRPACRSVLVNQWPTHHTSTTLKSPRTL